MGLQTLAKAMMQDPGKSCPSFKAEPTYWETGIGLVMAMARP